MLKKYRASGQADVPGGIDFSQGVRKEDGRLCVMKEIEVDTLVKDPVLECTHKNVEKCHYTYITQFKPSKEEVCLYNVNIFRNISFHILIFFVDKLDLIYSC